MSDVSTNTHRVAWRADASTAIADSTVQGVSQPSSSSSRQRRNVFFVGAPKCGTTSLYDALERNGRFSLPRAKEPIRFCEDVIAERPTVTENRLPRFAGRQRTAAVHACYVETAEEYEALFADSRERTRLDFCTFNFASRVAPREIHRYDPEACIVIVARDPLKRVTSHYAMDRAHGYVAGSLNEALEAEIALGADANFSNSRLYLRQTDYEAAYRRYRQYFSAEQVVLIVMEELFAAESESLEALESALGERVALDLQRTDRNGAVAPRNAAIARLVQSGTYRRLRSRWSGAMPRNLRQHLRSTLFQRDNHRSIADTGSLTVGILQELGAIRDRTERAIGRRIDRWAGVSGSSPSFATDDEGFAS